MLAIVLAQFRHVNYIVSSSDLFNACLRAVLVQARGSMLMFTAAFLTFMAIGGFPSFVEDMKVCGIRHILILFLHLFLW